MLNYKVRWGRKVRKVTEHDIIIFFLIYYDIFCNHNTFLENKTHQYIIKKNDPRMTNKLDKNWTGKLQTL